MSDLYTEACPSTYASQDYKVNIRHAMLDALRKLGRPASSVELQHHIHMGIGAQTITQAAAREPRYFVITGCFSKRKRAKGQNRTTMIDMHPHLRAYA